VKTAEETFLMSTSRFFAFIKRVFLNTATSVPHSNHKTALTALFLSRLPACSLHTAVKAATHTQVKPMLSHVSRDVPESASKFTTAYYTWRRKYAE